MSEANQEVLLDDDLAEEDFNDALASLQKSLKSDSKDAFRKRKGKMSKDEDEEDESEEEEGEDIEYDKFISEALAEEPEAAAAIDVEPFLRQLVKGLDESIETLYKAVETRLGRVERLMKSQGALLVQTAKLEKSTADMVAKIGGQPVTSESVKVLSKSRFENDNGSKISH